MRKPLLCKRCRTPMRGIHLNDVCARCIKAVNKQIKQVKNRTERLGKKP